MGNASKIDFKIQKNWKKREEVKLQKKRKEEEDDYDPRTIEKWAEKKLQFTEEQKRKRKEKLLRGWTQKKGREREYIEIVWQKK